jgi:hypothetical protein
LHVRIELSLPGEDVIVSHDATLGSTARTAPRRNESSGHEDIKVAIHAAFDVARRRLEDTVRRLRAHESAGAARN